MEKIRRIINTFKYGDAKVKAVLAFTILAGIGTISFLVAAILLQQMLWFFLAVVCAFVTISLAQTFMISGDEENDAPRKLEQVENVSYETELRMPEITLDNENYLNQEVSDFNESSQNEQTEDGLEEITNKTDQEKKKKAKKKKAKKTKNKKSKKDSLDSLDSEDEASLENASENQDDDLLNASLTDDQKDELMQMMRQNVEEKVGVNLSELDSDEEEIKRSEEGQEELHVVRITEESIKTFDRKKIKKVMHKYKVKRDYRMVMIDRSEKLQIHQTPAYIWVHGKEFHILLIEEEPRHLTMPIFKFREITYLKKQQANEDIDYAPYKGKSMLADLFRPYLPDYTHSTVMDDLTAYKNLYGIAPDIYFTNRSAANVFDLLSLEFRVDDKVTMSPKVNYYFKDAYKANIMLRDNVIDANGYADKISRILDGMAKSSISYNEFKETLNLMIKNKLITQEFAMYYMEVRDKNVRG